MVVLFTHNDLDGVGCGILLRCVYGDKADIRYNSVSSLDSQLEKYLEKTKNKPKKDGHLYITDLAVGAANEERLTYTANEGRKVRLLDHHKTSLHLDRHSWASIQLQYEDGRLTCATSLLYDYLIQHRLLKPTPAMEEFVELVRQYDTWEWEQQNNVTAKRLNDLFFLYALEDFEEVMVPRLLAKEEPFQFTDFEEKLLELEEEKIERYLRRKKRELVQTCIHGKYVGIIHAESYHSELSHELGREFPHLDYMVILNMGGRRMSLRTIHEDIDVSEIAVRYGGGGHAKAAGCPLTEEVLKLYTIEPFTQEPIRCDAGRNSYNTKGSAYGVLYENHAQDQLFLFTSGDRWYIDRNDQVLDQVFDTFEEAERFIKREYSGWLARDEQFIQYLMNHAGNRKVR